MADDLYIPGVVAIPLYRRDGNGYVEKARVVPWLFRGLYELAVGFGGAVAYNLSTIRGMPAGDTFCCHHSLRGESCEYLRVDDVHRATTHLLALKAALADPAEAAP